MKCFLKLRHVRDNAVGTVFFRRVGIDCGPHPLGFIARLAAPALAVTDKEALVGREAVYGLERLAFGVVLPGFVGEQKAAEISDIFAQREFAVDFNVVDHGIGGVLI